jgi:uncharacterized protein YkwD
MPIVWLAAMLVATQSYAQTKPPAQRQPTPAVQTKTAASKPSAAEQTLFDSANRERQSRGLRPLKWNAQLAAAAQAHAQKMAETGTLSHQFSGEMDMGTRIRVAGVRFNSAAENVALGTTAAGIHAQWMNSPAHRGNILDPQMDSLGVSVVARGGQLFAVQDFALASQ